MIVNTCCVFGTRPEAIKITQHPPLLFKLLLNYFLEQCAQRDQQLIMY